MVIKTNNTVNYELIFLKYGLMYDCDRLIVMKVIKIPERQGDIISFIASSFTFD